MKMKELERRTGVSREAIRFYIREGLLPEPERPKKNVARYHDVHVTAIQSIKQLQDEQSLPLDVIKTMLAAKAKAVNVKGNAFPELGERLRDRLDGEAGAPSLSLKHAAETTGVSVGKIKKLVKAGILRLCDDAKGVPAINARNARILERWVELEAAGFNVGNGFGVSEAKLYADFIEWLAEQETARFHKNLLHRLKKDDAVDAAEQGIALLNEILGLMRTEAILTYLSQSDISKLEKPKPRD